MAILRELYTAHATIDQLRARVQELEAAVQAASPSNGLVDRQYEVVDAGAGRK